ncbi:hypothetical protein [Actinocorallia herbida]|uniref:hypothetical protein n=1 Tax=Actinocorallia herbida TaxID=58109 RepID=UPI000F4C0732|nr:hypothetical protein [Actinocorallia herbida]
MLLPSESITAVFFDVGRRGEEGAERLPDGFGLERNGRLDDLLLEAAQPGRRFDLVAVQSASRLSCARDSSASVLLRLAAAGVPVRAVKRARRRVARV